jgi:hypothetical protein
VLEYHELRSSEEEGWTQEKTGAALGITQANVNQKISFAREFIAGNTMVAEAPKYTAARGIVQRAESRRVEEDLASISRRSKAPASADVDPDSILCADFNEWASTYDGPRFNFLHCGFPYGIGANKFNQGSAPLHGGYSDTEDDYWKLCRTLAGKHENWLALAHRRDGGHSEYFRPSNLAD